MEEKNNDECALFNHSCNPTCGFAEDACGDNVIAIRDIEPGQELTYHYGTLETESSLIYGLECKCSSSNCCGKLYFDFYRDPAFVNKYFEYMTPYLKSKSLEMQEKWYSTSCYVKRYLPNDKYAKSFSYLSKSLSSSEDSTDESSCDVECWRKGLCSLHLIKQNELVGSFLSEEQIHESNHYFRNDSISPNCYILDKNIYASFDIHPETELTLDLDKRSAV
jgi:SET domain-containing protein